jgi:hypothetical protein
MKQTEIGDTKPTQVEVTMGKRWYFSETEPTAKPGDCHANQTYKLKEKWTLKLVAKQPKQSTFAAHHSKQS